MGPGPVRLTPPDREGLVAEVLLLVAWTRRPRWPFQHLQRDLASVGGALQVAPGLRGDLYYPVWIRLGSWATS